MTKAWLWGPGRIAPEHRGLTKREVLGRLASVRADYLAKLLGRPGPDDARYICRLERARFALLAELDRVSEERFAAPQDDVPPCDGDCPNRAACEAERVCAGWSLADFAGHLLTHEEKNVDPDVNETLPHMAEHEETHLRQVQALVARFAP
ncbi:MAG TPA: hypothetical protein VEH62_05590 [Gemmatimonadales bacterium]|nr:hypothetical protein [Gemmatimonadales bacterium]